MLRLSELKLPLDHPAEALPAAIVARLGIAPAELLRWEIARRANDARRKSAILITLAIIVRPPIVRSGGRSRKGADRPLSANPVKD